MKEIIKIESNLPNNYLRIELFLFNVCNHRCWYCFPGSNEGTHRWPDYDLLIDNLSHLLNYYKQHQNKERFYFHIIGGEPTIWPNLTDFVSYFKENYNTLISISTNGSRTLKWWDENGQNFDHTMISCHHQFVDPAHIIKVGDLLYSKNKSLSVKVLMDPTAWNQCVHLIETLKGSNKSWPIDAQEVHHHSIRYTEDQKKYLSKSLKRIPNVFWWLKAQTIPDKKSTVTFNDNSTKKVPHNWISLNSLNSFDGWKCNIGIDTLYIDKSGSIQGACGENLYDLPYQFNIFDKNFKNNFNPKIIPTTCTRNKCFCQPEINTTKFKIL